MKKLIRPLSPNLKKTKPQNLNLSLIVVCGRSEESWGDWEDGRMGGWEDGRMGRINC
jgi:hypothetical protein